MKSVLAAFAAAALMLTAVAPRAQAPSPGALPAPGFHHLHLNSINPDAAIAFYVRNFPTTSKTTFAGQPALKSPTSVLVLFNKVDQPPPTQPQTSIWHFGWHVTDEEKALATFRSTGAFLLPLYTSDAGGTVAISSQTWPGTGGVLGLTRNQIADAKAKGVKPAGGAGFGYVRGPDDVMIEYQGNMPAERFNHIHMYWEQPFCAQLWYQTHLNAARTPARGGQPPRTEANCAVPRGTDKTWPALDVEGMYRTPSVTSVAFDDVSLFSYMNQTDTPLASTRGHAADHFALSVKDLDAWIAKLRSENVRLLEQPYQVGDLRALMIEGPSREAIELIEVK
jgi:catechol 2,3-dioxygenase-like lactoylglutathione lyase family enzyme